MNLNKVVKATLIVSSLVLTQGAQAGLVSCPSNFTAANSTAKVKNVAGTTTAASACQIVTPNAANTPTVANINTAGFFGYSDWTQNGTNLLVAANSATGTWAISGANFLLNDYMIVFRDGELTNLTGFLLNETVTNGVWSTPFTEPPFDFPNNLTRNVRDYTIVQRLNPNQVPEPGILSLLGLGLAGFAASRRRSVNR